MDRRTRWQLMVAVVFFAGAVVLWFRFLDRDGSGSERAYFYDLSEQKLFTAPRTSVPPVRGINDDEEDGVRAVVIAPPDSNDPDQRRIAYLEKYSPLLRKQFLAMRGESDADAPTRPNISRVDAQSHIFVRRVDEEDWVAVNTPEGERILTEWQAPGADGVVPVVCVP
jgi:hypothetical protein